MKRETHINVLNGSDVCMYLCMFMYVFVHHTVNTFIFDIHVMKNQKIRVYFSVLSLAMFLDVSLKGS